MKRTIIFKKDKNKNYVFEEKGSKNKLIINCIDKKLSGQKLYDAFFKNDKFNENDWFVLDTKLKIIDGTDRHIFDNMKYLFEEIGKSFKDSQSNVEENNEINNIQNK